MKEVFRLCLIFFLLLSLPNISSAELSPQKTILDNGLAVIIQEMPASPVVSVYVLVKTGSATEDQFIGSGISHYLEHMVFKGTKKRKVGEIASTVQALGGVMNASTSFDYTMYKITLPNEHVSVAIDILADAMQNATMPQEEIDKERDVILGEMRLHEDNPSRSLSQEAFSKVYFNHPYQHPIIGYKSLLLELSRDDLLQYYDSKYVANNMVLSISGGIDAKEILPQIMNTFGAMKRHSLKPRHLPVDPIQTRPAYFEKEYPTDLARMAILYPSVSLLDPDLYALDVLANILGQGRSSRLYQDLYENKKLVYSVNVGNYTPVDRGVFQINATFDYDQKEQIVNDVNHHIASIRKSGVHKDELLKAKNQVKSQYVFSQQTSDAVAHGFAIDEAYTGDPQFSKHYVQLIGNVTNDDIIRVARIYLRDEKQNVVILAPEDNLKNKEISKTVDIKPVIKSMKLSNGIRVLIEENKTNALISVRLALRGGTREESYEKFGLSNILAGSWIKGTTKRSSEDIARFTDENGMHLDAFSGRNSIGLEMDFLKENIDDALKLLEDLLLNPIFNESDVEKAKILALKSIESKKDNILGFSVNELKELIFADHPFGMDTLGRPQTVSSITTGDVRSFYNKQLSPENLVISIFGNVNAEDVFNKINQSHIARLKSRMVDLNTHNVESIKSLIEKTIYLDKQQALVLIGFQGPTMFDEDFYAVDVMTSILGSSFSGRLFNSVREELGQAYTLGGGMIPGMETGLIYFYVLTSQEYVNDVKRVVFKEIEHIRSDLISDTELSNMKTHLSGLHQMQHQTLAQKAFVSALDELYGLGYQHWQLYPSKIKDVTSENVRRAAKTYLQQDKAAILMTLPKRSRIIDLDDE